MDKANMFEFFKIQLLSFENSEDIFDLHKGTPIRYVCNMQRHGCLNPRIIEADPFLFVHNDRLFLFYELKDFKTSGVLMMTSTADLKKWTKPVCVLKEPYHLSFPWVFEHNRIIYMLPETGASGSIRLYKAKNDGLTEFEYCATLLTEPKDKIVEMHYGDSCIYEKDSAFYLFTQLQYEDKINTLELYTSNCLMGPYVSHPMSPIQHSQKLGRNAGSLLNQDGKLYRFSQDCTDFYGDNVHITEIDLITPNDFKEHIVAENIIPSDIDFYCNGGHQFNAVQFKDRWIVATDAKEYHPLWGIRIINKIKNLL